MNFTEENIARFDQYLEQELSKTECDEFERELANDRALQQEFEDYKRFIGQIEAAEINAFTAQLKKWDEVEPASIAQRKKTQVYSLRFLVAAAVVVIGLVISVNYFFNFSSSSDLVAVYYQPYDNVITIRGAKEDLDDALLKYEEKNYSEALTIFEAYPENPIAIFYAGECQMALKNYQKGINAFKKTIEFDGIFTEIAEFHLALAYLGNDNKKEAKEQLKAIPTTSDFYEPAHDLLRELK